MKILTNKPEEGFFATFGQNHRHTRIDNDNKPMQFNKDTICVFTDIINPQDVITKMYKLFGTEWSLLYDENDFDSEHWPNGVFIQMN